MFKKPSKELVKVYLALKMKQPNTNMTTYQFVEETGCARRTAHQHASNLAKAGIFKIAKRFPFDLYSFRDVDEQLDAAAIDYSLVELTATPISVPPPVPALKTVLARIMHHMPRF